MLLNVAKIKKPTSGCFTEFETTPIILGTASLTNLPERRRCMVCGEIIGGGFFSYFAIEYDSS